MTWPSSAGRVMELLGVPLAEVVVCLDYDGTLAPIVADPDAAVPLAGTRDVLATLSRRCALVALVSGRPALHLDRHLGAAGVRCVGLYGMEEVMDGAVVVHPEVRKWQERLAGARDAIARLPEVVASGAWVEDKGLAVGVHLRRTEDPERWMEPVARAVRALAVTAGLRVVDGRLVIEVRPPTAGDKGDVIARLLAETGAPGVIMVGDDRGDLPAFAAVRAHVAHGGHGAAVAVQSPEVATEVLEAADVIVDGPLGVRGLLEGLIALPERCI